jgi:GMP synthase-like glutamine amidotransferase
MTVLVVDMNWQGAPLAQYEFVQPVLSVVEPLMPCTVKHYLNVDPSEVENYSHIILSGTTLKDFEFLDHLECFHWIKTCTKPILGICAGMQTIIRLYGEQLVPCQQVGMTETATTRPNPLFSGAFQAYSLHTYSIAPESQTFDAIAESARCIQAIAHKHKPIYGVQFHPEVRNPDILKRFLQTR